MELQARLTNPIGTQVGQGRQSPLSTGVSSSFHNLRTAVLSWFSNFIGTSKAASGSRFGSPTVSNPAAIATANPTTNSPPEHLLLCIKSGRFGLALYQELVTNISSDRDLIRFLENNYVCRRGRLHPLLSLRKLAEISLVKVFPSPSNSGLVYLELAADLRSFLWI